MGQDGGPHAPGYARGMAATDKPEGDPLLRVEDLRVRFAGRGGAEATCAVDGVSLNIGRGESLGLSNSHLGEGRCHPGCCRGDSLGRLQFVSSNDLAPQLGCVVELPRE